MVARSDEECSTKAMQIVSASNGNRGGRRRIAKDRRCSGTTTVARCLALGSTCVLLSHHHRTTQGLLPLSHAHSHFEAAAVVPSRSTIVRETKRKHYRRLRSLRSSSSNGIFDSSNPRLTPDQFRACLRDMSLADSDRDGRLDGSEFVSFLSHNAVANGHDWGLHDGATEGEAKEETQQLTMADLPLEFSMLFHTTACLCAYNDRPPSGEEGEEGAEDFGCCEGDNEHVAVIDVDAMTTMTMTTEQESYARGFCTEAFYDYAVLTSPPTSPTTSPVAATPPPPAPTSEPIAAITAAPTRATTPAPTAAVVVTPAPTKAVTPAPTVAATAPPTTRPVASTDKPTASPNASPTTSLPTASTASPITASPTTKTPTASPNDRPSTSPPTSSPITEAPTLRPSRSPATFSPSLKPTRSPTFKPVTSTPTSRPTIATTAPTTRGNVVVAIDFAYGISSNCNLTANDILMGNFGVTVKDGLLAATEQAVVEILNATYPRAGSGGDGGGGQENRAAIEGGDSEENGAGGVGDGGGSTEQQQASSSEMTPGDGARNAGLLDEGTTKGGGAVRGGDDVSGRAEEDGPMPSREAPGEGFRVRVRGSPREQHRGTGRDLAILARHPDGERRGRRSLVYYSSDENPAIISSMVDVPCQPGKNCMRVESTLYLTLEEGDDKEDIERVVSEGIQAGIQDGSLFSRIPRDTVFCPPVTARPTASEPVTPPPSERPTPSPVALTAAPTDRPVTASPTMSPTPGPQVLTGSPTFVGPFSVSITYDISNSCGLKADAIMSGEGNTLKEGLIVAAETVARTILEEEFPRPGDEPTRKRRRRGLRQRQRGLLAGKRSGDDGERRMRRELAYYPDDYPVEIERILDIEAGCPLGESCLLVISTITVMIEPGDDVREVNAAITEGMQRSFTDGTFFAAIPEDTVICQ